MSRKITSIAAALATTATLAVAAGPAAADDSTAAPTTTGAQSVTVNPAPARPQTLVFKIGRFHAN